MITRKNPERLRIRGFKNLNGYSLTKIAPIFKSDLRSLSKGTSLKVDSSLQAIAAAQPAACPVAIQVA